MGARAWRRQRGGHVRTRGGGVSAPPGFAPTRSSWMRGAACDVDGARRRAPAALPLDPRADVAASPFVVSGGCAARELSLIAPRCQRTAVSARVSVALPSRRTRASRPQLSYAYVYSPAASLAGPLARKREIESDTPAFCYCFSSIFRVLFEHMSHPAFALPPRAPAAAPRPRVGVAPWPFRIRSRGGAGARGHPIASPSDKIMMKNQDRQPTTCGIVIERAERRTERAIILRSLRSTARDGG